MIEETTTLHQLFEDKKAHFEEVEVKWNEERFGLTICLEGDVIARSQLRKRWKKSR